MVNFIITRTLPLFLLLTDILKNHFLFGNKNPKIRYETVVIIV